MSFLQTLMNQHQFWSYAIQASLIGIAIFSIWILVESFSKRPLWGFFFLTSIALFALSFVSLHGSPIQTNTFRNMHAVLTILILYLVLSPTLLFLFFRRRRYQ